MKRSLVFMSFLTSLIWTPPLSFAQNGKSPESKVAFIGTYTKKEGHVDGKAEGIYSVSMDAKTGALRFGSTLAVITNPSFVKTSPDGEFLYAVSELGPKDASSGEIYSYKILPDNSLKLLNSLPTNGLAPCNIEVDPSGNFVFVANYLGGVVTMYQKITDGSLEEKQVITLENKEKSHPHSVTISEDNSTAYIADLGNDRIWIFDLDIKKGRLQPHQQPFIALETGSGPRHFTLSGDGEYAYSMNELNSTVSVFRILENGGLDLLQNISSLPKDFKEKNSGADIHLHPSGEFLYVSNRGHNSIAIFKVDEASGELKTVGHADTRGRTPRNFAIAPGGEFLFVANQDSGNITSFKIDEQSAELEFMESLEIPTPVCIEFK